jgi:hypothetical protein
LKANNNFAKFINVSHPNLAFLLSNIQINQSEVERKLDYLISNPVYNPQRISEKEKLIRLKKIVENYDSYYGLTFLKAIALTYGWKVE